MKPHSIVEGWDLQIIGLLCLCFVFFICIVGMTLVIKIQLGLLLVLILCIISVFVGPLFFAFLILIRESHAYS